MKKYILKYAGEAINDLLSIYDYIAIEKQDSLSVTNLINKIQDSINSLELFPYRHKLVDWSPWKEMRLRFLVIGNFFAFYIIVENELIVNVIRIMSCRKNAQLIFH